MLASTRPIRVGVVSFVNTLPLIDGLERLGDLELRQSVPSLLVDQLLAEEVEIALCSSIDYQRSPQPLVMLPAGALGCDGPTMTVRLYSTVPIERITTVHCDTDSHTSIALMRILLAEVFKITPNTIDYNAREHVAGNRPLDWPDAMLLIGDKVVTDSPPAVRYPHQLDLGEAWRDMTSTPFVFAAWMGLATADHDRLRAASAILDRQRRANRLKLDSIVHYRARPRNWPSDLAAQYLKQRLVYDFGEAQRRGLELFFTKAHQHGLIDQVRPLHVIE